MSVKHKPVNVEIWESTRIGAVLETSEGALRVDRGTAILVCCPAHTHIAEGFKAVPLAVHEPVILK